MSRSSKIFGLIQPHVPGAVMCGNVLVIKPTGYIMRGFLLETTSHKDHVKLWRIVMPLLRPFRHVILSYSSMISGEHAGLVHIDKKAYRASADHVFEKIRNHVEPLRQLSEPRDFLNHVAYMSANRMLNVRVDFGLTHYLLGNTGLAFQIFKDLKSDISCLEERWHAEIGPLIRQVVDQLERDAPGLLKVINAWRDQNIATLGLTASCETAVKPSLVK